MRKGITTDAISTSSLHCQRYLRTISFSQNPEITRRVLRVLDLSSTAISTLPECVGKLKLLKVLNLSNTKIREVPDCVRRLKCLEYLDVSECTSIQSVPDWIGDLKSLSYLNLKNCSKELTRNYLPKGISSLSSLKTLRSRAFPLPAEENEFLNVKDLGNLTNLHEIYFFLEDEGGLRSVEDGSLERLVKMRILCVGNGILAREGDIEESNLPALPEKMNIMKDLQHLFLIRFSVPNWICSMGNLIELTFYDCSGYPSLETMPNLQSLWLVKDSRCRELPEKFGESGGFPKLVRLMINEFPLLEELPALEEGAMQRLEVLWIYNCPRVKKVPEGLDLLSRLKAIDVEQASGELEERLKEGGEDWLKIKANNPNIEIS
ncbi:hypothetical protein SUGI_0353670 [Cryptomeria japonica]|uniref:disease resistance protein RPV1-like n=1 Tax=Cryptomeria japonica TaxID=3369 RepID=UPI002408F07C|nr:disease resistance protein RPV1-like [Cryptomeria japonica]GLJ19571.1 hypothetical protein SUGI_0353670 [Cryptomeria japonica]